MREKRNKILKRQSGDRDMFGFQATNYRIFGLALLVLILGYIALAQPPVDGFMTLTLAPILLIIGYCVLIPWALFWKPRQPKSE